MFRALIFLCFLLAPYHAVKSQDRSISFEDLERLQYVQARPVIILILTDWCKYCHALKNTMLKNKEVSDVLNTNYYLIFLNAEEKRDIVYRGRKFSFKPSGNKTGIHELAAELGTINNKISYPSLCFLNANNEIIYQHDGYLNSKDLLGLLKELSPK